MGGLDRDFHKAAIQQRALRILQQLPQDLPLASASSGSACSVSWRMYC